MPTPADVVRGCIRAQTHSTSNPPGGAQLSTLGVDTNRLEGCLNTNLPLPPGIPYAHDSIDPLWTVDVLIGDARARKAAGGAKAIHLMAVMPAGGGGTLAHFKIGKAPKAAPKTASKAAPKAAPKKTLKKKPKSNS